MARLHHLEWETRAECLDAIASSYGEYPPAGDVPAWWGEFEKWYQEQKAKAKDGVVSVVLRTDTQYYEDEDEEDDDEEPDGTDEEPEEPEE